MSWPTRDGDLQARRFCPAPGPTRGTIASRWLPPSSERGGTPSERIECAVIGGDGRVAVAMGKSVHVLAPDLRPLERHDFDGYVRDVVAVPEGFLAVEKHDVRGLCGATFPQGLTAQVAKYPFGTRRLPDGTVLIWDGSELGRVDPVKEAVIARYQTDSTMASTRHVAIAPDGTIWSGMAMSWSSEDDPTEYFAAVAAFTPEGRKLMEWSYDDGIPSSTGFDLQVLAADGLGLASEHGTAILTRSAKRLARFVELSHVALGPQGLVGTKGHEILRTTLDGATLETVARLRDDDFVRRIALDGAGHVYLGTTTGIIGLDAHGAEMFRVEPFNTGALLLGEGFLIAAGQENGAGLIRVH